MAKWKCSVCGTVVDGRGKKGHARIKDGKHDGEVTYTKVEAENDGNDNNSSNNNDDSITDNNNSQDNINIVGDGGGIPSGNDNKDAGRNDTEHDTTESVPNSIQIIDSNTGKKEKGIVDQVLEKLFSEELAPITTSILGALAAKLQQPNNATEDGMLTAEDGSKHQMI